MKKTINKTELLELLNAQMSYPLFREHRTVLSIEELSFYNEYVYIKAKTFSTIPSVEIGFLWSDKSNHVIKIAGDRGCFFDNVELLQPQITTQSAVDYIRFVLGNVWNDNGAIRVCQSIDDVEFSGSPSHSQLSHLTNSIKAATVSERDDVIVVVCNIVYGLILYQATIELQRNGLFEIVDEEPLSEEIEALRTLFLE